MVAFIVRLNDILYTIYIYNFIQNLLRGERGSHSIHTHIIHTLQCTVQATTLHRQQHRA